MMERKAEKGYTLLRTGWPSPSILGGELGRGGYPPSWPYCFMTRAQVSQAAAAAVAVAAQEGVCPVFAHNKNNLTLSLTLSLGSEIFWH